MSPKSPSRSQNEKHVSTPPSISRLNSLSLSPRSRDRPSSTRSKRDNSGTPGSSSKKDLPPVFWYMEAGDWQKAAERVRRHPRDAKMWGTLKTKDSTVSSVSSPSSVSSTSGTRRLALHHACFKLRSAGSTPPPIELPPLQRSPSNGQEGVHRGTVQFEEIDPFVLICNFIVELIEVYPGAAGERESRHGCLPLHLASFASCASRASESGEGDSVSTNSNPSRPPSITRRSASDATSVTNMSAMNAEESWNGAGSLNRHSVSSGSENLQIHGRREQFAVKVINALLDAYPKAIRVDSEGGRLPLHTACAGRATPRVISTLLTAYPAAARHRNKDGFLPLHLSAHWGVSHPNVAISLLKAYPDATVGRNRWERTPLEEALCMAGENGRPHQAPLVRALRKHPSFWTRSDDISHFLPKAPKTSMVVDVDESLASTEDEDVYALSKDRVSAEDSYSQEEFGQEVALASDSSPGIVGRFVNGRSKGKSASRRRDLDLSLPLDNLILNRKWDAVIEKIRLDPLETEKELKVMTRGGFKANTGFFALHYACERDPPLAVCQVLIEAYPVAVLTRCMPGGCLPLHIACTWHCSPDIARALLSADQGGVAVKDELGNVALHSACFSGVDAGIVETLLMTDPRAVLARNHQGSRPVDICKRLRHQNRTAVSQLIARRQDAFARHRRSKSSGTWSTVSTEAHQWNQSFTNTENEEDLMVRDPMVQVEALHKADDDKQELLWI